jgi:hypothetical protein
MLKKQLLSDIDKHGVQLYDFPEGDPEQDDDTQPLDRSLKVRHFCHLRIILMCVCVFLIGIDSFRYNGQ